MEDLRKRAQELKAYAQSVESKAQGRMEEEIGKCRGMILDEEILKRLTAKITVYLRAKEAREEIETFLREVEE